MSRKKLQSKSVFDMPSEAHISFFESQEATPIEEQPMLMLEIEAIEFAPEQPRDRKYISEQEIEELVPSIHRHGVLQPIVVRRKEAGRYELIAGERRYRASLKAGLQTIPAVVKDVSDNDAYEIALIENLQRKDLNPIEKTSGILKLCGQMRNLTTKEMSSEFYSLTNMTQSETHNVVSLPAWQEINRVFNNLGKELRSFAVHDLPMLGWPMEVQDALRAGHIQPGHGRVITKIKDQEKRKELLQLAIEEDLSVRELNQLYKKIEMVSLPTSSKKQFSSKVTHPLVERLSHFCKLYKAPKKWDSLSEELQGEASQLQNEIDERLQRLENLLK